MLTTNETNRPEEVYQAYVNLEYIERNYNLDDSEKATLGAEAWESACNKYKNTHSIPDDGSILFWWENNYVWLADSNGVCIPGKEEENDDLARLFETEYEDLLEANE